VADRARGLRDVLIVAAVGVAVVLGAAAVTAFLPVGAQDIVFRTPLLILVLVVGTAGVLWRITRPGNGSR
jgi:FtsH-binding integral membrane protein